MPTCSAYRLWAEEWSERAEETGPYWTLTGRETDSREVCDGQRRILVEVLRLDEALQQVPAHGGYFIDRGDVEGRSSCSLPSRRCRRVGAGLFGVASLTSGAVGGWL